MRVQMMRSIARSSTGGSSLRWQRGFTLHEILVVLALISIVVGITIPNLRRAMVRAELLTEVKTIRQSLGVARMHAIKNSRRVGVLLLPFSSGSASGHTVVAWVDTNENGVADSGEEEVGRWRLKPETTVKDFQDLGGNPIAAKTLHPLTAGTRGVVYLADGSAMVHLLLVGAGTGAMMISDRHGNEIALILRASGGVDEQMRVPDTDTWTSQLRHWQY